MSALRTMTILIFIWAGTALGFDVAVHLLVAAVIPVSMVWPTVAAAMAAGGLLGYLVFRELEKLVVKRPQMTEKLNRYAGYVVAASWGYMVGSYSSSVPHLPPPFPAMATAAIAVYTAATVLLIRATLRAHTGADNEDEFAR